MPADTHAVSPLAALIQSVIDQEAANGNRLNASIIARRGTDVTRGNVARYLSHPLDRAIPYEKRRGLALGLRVHPVVVDRAVAESIGLMLDLPADDWRTDPNLNAEDRKAIADFIAYRKQMRQAG